MGRKAFIKKIITTFAAENTQTNDYKKMSSLTLTIVIVFVIGYLFIALESLTKINKAAVALLMFVACWTIFMIDPGSYLSAAIGPHAGNVVSEVIEKHLGSTSTTLFFLMGAMTIVEVIDQNGGFNFVRDTLKTKSKKTLLWRIMFMTFVLSAILDNLTTSIVMVMILRKLVESKKDRLIYASLVVIAANSGGAFSPIGDVTTIMLWNKGLITAAGVIKEIFIPSLVSAVIPAYILSLSLKGELVTVTPNSGTLAEANELTKAQRKAVFFIGVGGLIFVPIFKSITHLPPFVGILLVLGLLWTVTELFYAHLHGREEKGGMQKRVTNILSRIDMSTILFFLGILMAVACLETIGVLETLGEGLNVTFNGNHYLVTGIIGVLSSIVDNGPLVAGCMGMYPVAEVGDMAVDGIFWQLLAYCAGVGGSMLIIGSAAGVVVMGLEKITFGWYMKKITWWVIWQVSSFIGLKRASWDYKHHSMARVVEILTSTTLASLFHQPSPFHSRAVFAGLAPHLGLELAGEIVGRVKVEAIGYLLDAHVCGREQFLGPLQAQVLLVQCGRHARVFLEKFTEIGIARPQFCGNLMHGDFRFHSLAYHDACLGNHLHIASTPVELHVALQRIHQSQQVVHYACQELLRAGTLLFGCLDGRAVKHDHIARISNVIDGLVNRKETIVHPVVHVAPLETNPIAFPHITFYWMISVPHTWKHQEHVSCLESHIFHSRG